ncbi:MAG: MBL fold metallo-hydrolase [Patescibacteria group bacterium]
MEISFAGHSCFKVKGKTSSIVFDPYSSEIGYKLPKLEADVVCVSHNHFDHNFVEGVKGSDGSVPFVINAPGEYDLKGVYVRGFKSFHDDKEGKERGLNTIYYVEVDGIFMLHLGDLGHVLPDDIVSELEVVDVLFVPIGGIYTIGTEEVDEIISQLEPSIVVPMHFRTEKLLVPKASEMNPLEKFTNEWGSDGVKKVDKLKIFQKSDLPEETQIVVIEQL